MENGKRIPVLLVEDTNAGEARCHKLLGADFNIRRAKDPTDATDTFQEMAEGNFSPQCIIVDLTLENDYEDAFPFMTAIRQTYPRLPIVIWTKHSDEIKQEALTAANGVSVALSKYVDDDQLRDVVMNLIEQGKKAA
jgi:DNA-binding NtrC family response regulator